jgi:uncharacterized membrane protein YagU involved in acid resistance
MKMEIGKQAAIGALAGAAGTAVIQGMMAGSQRFAPETLPPMKKDPGEFMVEQAKSALPRKVRKKIPQKAESAVASTLGLGYGSTFGLLYAALCANRRSSSATRVLVDGAALGTATWAVGYLGWLPATRLMPPVWKQEPKQILSGILSHVLFGIATVGVFTWLARKL